MKHFASPAFWDAYEKLPVAVRQLADRNYEFLKRDPQHPSLHSRKSGASGLFVLDCDTAHLRLKWKVGFFGSGLDRMRTMMR